MYNGFIVMVTTQCSGQKKGATPKIEMAREVVFAERTD